MTIGYAESHDQALVGDQTVGEQLRLLLGNSSLRSLVACYWATQAPVGGRLDQEEEVLA